MDTLEYRPRGEDGGPVLWRDKTPQEVCREQYPDCILRKETTAPKSLRTGVDYCDLYNVIKPDETDHRKPGEWQASLVPLLRKA